MTNSLLLTLCTFAQRVLAPSSVDEILLQMYVKWSTNFRGFFTLNRDNIFLFKRHGLCLICIDVLAT